MASSAHLMMNRYVGRLSQTILVTHCREKRREELCKPIACATRERRRMFRIEIPGSVSYVENPCSILPGRVPPTGFIERPGTSVPQFPAPLCLHQIHRSALAGPPRPPSRPLWPTSRGRHLKCPSPLASFDDCDRVPFMRSVSTRPRQSCRARRKHAWIESTTATARAVIGSFAFFYSSFLFVPTIFDIVTRPALSIMVTLSVCRRRL